MRQNNFWLSSGTMQEPINHFFFGCARLQPAPQTSPKTLLPKKVYSYVIHAMGEHLEDLNAKLQWKQASFYFSDIEQPLDIYAPMLRIGYSDPCPSVCTPIIESTGALTFKRIENPYFSETEWEDGLISLFEIIRLHHHLTGPNGNGRLLKSTSYSRENGIQPDWYSTPVITQRGDICQSIFRYLESNPEVFDNCFELLRSIGIDFNMRQISASEFYSALSQPPNDSSDSILWSQRWAELKQWWCHWQKDYLENIMVWPSEEAKAEVLDHFECDYSSSFYGQLLVEETMPLILRGLLWRMAHSVPVKARGVYS